MDSEQILVEGDKIVVQQTTTTVAYEASGAEIDSNIADIQIDIKTHQDAIDADNAQIEKLQGYKSKLSK